MSAHPVVQVFEPRLTLWTRPADLPEPLQLRLEERVGCQPLLCVDLSL